MKKRVEHTTIRNENLFCLNCGGAHSIGFPTTVPDLNKKIKAFNTLHAECPKTYVEPVADGGKSVYDRAMWWITSGETGSSSKTMFGLFMHGITERPSHPYDPDDFKRCYKLLELIPEWKERIMELKVLSTAWENLANNWGKLTEMFEQNERESWKNYKVIGMFEYMQKLIQTKE